MDPLIIIPARGGSKGIPKKNIKLLNGKPLILHTIDVAKEITQCENICVSTDSEEIRSIVERSGLKVPFIRPSEYSTDDASSEVVIKHALSYYESIGIFYRTVILLQPTSPFRTSKHVIEALNCMSDELDMVASVKLTASNPYYVLFEEDENGILKKSKKGTFNRRQDCPKVYELNGALYVINVNSLKNKGISNFDKIIKYCMTDIESLDIDEPLDWDIAEMIMKKIK